MTAVFQDFVFGDTRFTRHQAEQAAYASTKDMTSEERISVNNALLAKLDAAKLRFSGRILYQRDWLQDPYINTLVNVLVIINEPWLTTVLKHNHSRPRHYEDREELKSVALTGRGENAQGMIGAILQYDFQRCGGRAFTSYLARAITNSLIDSPRQQNNAKLIDGRMMHPTEDEPEPWFDRREHDPSEGASNHDLMEVLRHAIRRIPKERRPIAEFIVCHILETGERPTLEQIGHAHVPPLTRERAKQLTVDTLAKIKRQVEIIAPQLAKDGVNGWDEFQQAIGVDDKRTRQL